MIVERKLKISGHICRMGDNRSVKNVVFGIMDGQNRRGRSSREWVDDIKEWCRADVQILSVLAQGRSEWRQVVVEALDTNVRKPAWNEE